MSGNSSPLLLEDLFNLWKIGKLRDGLGQMIGLIVNVSPVNLGVRVAEESRAYVFRNPAGGQFAAGVMAQAVKAKGMNPMGAGCLGCLFILPEQGILNARFAN